jgi:hypothetical protein
MVVALASNDDDQSIVFNRVMEAFKRAFSDNTLMSACFAPMNLEFFFFHPAYLGTLE